MTLFKKILYCTVLPLSLACVPASAESDPCSDPTSHDAGTSEKAPLPEKIATVACAIKHAFQSRVRYHKTAEPVEMTVGSPPMISDDTGTPGDRRLEINLTASGDFADDGKRTEAPLLDVNYGIGDTIQLKLEIPYVHLATPAENGDDPQHLTHAHGVGDTTLGIKYRFYDSKDTGLSLAVYPQVRLRTPEANRAVSEGKTLVVLPLLLTKEFEKVSFTLNGGVARSDESRYFASIGAGTRLSDQLALLGEIAGSNLNARDERQILLNLGVRRKLSETRAISASIGHDIHAGGERPLHRYFSLSFQQMLGD